MVRIAGGPFAVALLWSAVMAVPGMAAGTAGGKSLSTAQSERYGTYLTDAEGKALYMFTPDTRGEGEASAKSTCYDQCAEAWPPMLTDGTPAASDKLDSALVDTIERKDGSMQATYGGWPLYYFIKDKGTGSVAGQDVHGFGGEWYLVSPDGSKIEKEG